MLEKDFSSFPPINHKGNNILVANVHSRNSQENFQMDDIDKCQTRASYHYLRTKSNIKRRLTIDHIHNNILAANAHSNNSQEKIQMDVIDKYLML